MKTKIAIITAVLCTAVFAAVDPSTVTFTVQSQNLSSGDRRTAKFIVRQENKIRVANGQSELPIGTNAEVKSSLEIALNSYLLRFMIESAARADAEADDKLSTEERRDVLRAVSDQLNAGKTAAQIQAAINAIH